MHEKLYTELVEQLGLIRVGFCVVCEATSAHAILNKEDEVIEYLCDQHAAEFRQFMAGYFKGREADYQRVSQES